MCLSRGSVAPTNSGRTCDERLTQRQGVRRQQVLKADLDCDPQTGRHIDNGPHSCGLQVGGL